MMPCRYVGTNTVSEEDTAKRQKKGDNKHTIVEQAHTTSLFYLSIMVQLPPQAATGIPFAGAASLGHRFDPLLEKISASIGSNEITAIVLGTILVPIVKIWYEQLLHNFHSIYINDSTTTTTSPKALIGGGDGKTTTTKSKTTTKTLVPYEKTTLYHIFNTISEGARIFISVTIVEILKLFVLSFGDDHNKLFSSIPIPKARFDHVTHVFAYTMYLLWGFKRFSVLKLYLLRKVMINTDIINNPGRLQIINRLSDYCLIFFGIFVFYEVLNYEMGYSLKSVLAVFSFATAVVSLATKDIITNFLNGILLSASDRIYEGDFISINGNIRKVNRMGWLETALRGSDNILYTIPNTELLTSQTSNLSRVKTCQVRQTLRFPYNVVDKLPKLSNDIKCEIRSSCPSIITDGSHPFQCYWVNFQSTYLEVIVDAHFRTKPVGDVYYENRQRCLQAIDRAIKMNDIPSYSGSG